MPSDLDDSCNCSGQWVRVQKEMLHLFNYKMDLGKVMTCLADPSCELPSRLGLVSEMLTSPDTQCSEENLPAVDARRITCSAGMMHYNMLCVLQMWMRRKFRQSALYFDHGLGYMKLALGCLEGSGWPLWPGQVLRNYRAFITAAFPPGRLHAELRTWNDGEKDVTYTAAGPTVDPGAFRWFSGPRTGLYCPPRSEENADEEPLNNGGGGGGGEIQKFDNSIVCAIPLVWPAERQAAQAIAETFAPDCEELIFFIAAPDAGVAQTAIETLEGLRAGGSRIKVVDLAAKWPEMIRDKEAALAAHGRTQVSGANQKDLLLFAFLAHSSSSHVGFGADWICRIETDSYFVPANFKRFVRHRQLNPSKPWFLGSIVFWQMHFEPRIITNEQVQCLSRAAAQRLAEHVHTVPFVETASYARCELAPGHRGDLMLAVCLAEVGITAYPEVTDRWGREYFLNYRMEDMGAYSPATSSGSAARDPRHFSTDGVMHWKGKAHIFMPCLAKNKFWASPFPISFHDYKDPKSLYRVHEVMLGRRQCTECPEGYEPQRAPIK